MRVSQEPGDIMSDSMSSKEEAIAKYKKLKGKRAGLIFVIAAGLASLNPVSIIPWLYYPFMLGIVAIGAILFRYPRRYS